METAASRVAAVARVHRNFHLDDEGESVSCITYLRRLCANLSGILEIPIEVQGDEGDIATKRIQPTGRIANELVTNAAKHGAGKITVTYKRDDLCALSVCDKGEGLAPDFDPTKSANGLGMKVVGVLAGQLGGELSAGPNPAGQGACLSVVFPRDFA